MRLRDREEKKWERNRERGKKIPKKGLEGADKKRSRRKREVGGEQRRR